MTTKYTPDYVHTHTHTHSSHIISTWTVKDFTYHNKFTEIHLTGTYSDYLLSLVRNNTDILIVKLKIFTYNWYFYVIFTDIYKYQKQNKRQQYTT
jgi:hypothetical protein